MSVRRGSLLTLLLVVPLLGGWKFIDGPKAWDTTDTGPNGTWPIDWHAGDVIPNGLSSHEDKREILQAAYDNWADVPCSPIEAVDGGDVDNDISGFSRPELTIITFDGGSKDDLGSGPLAAAVTHANNSVHSRNGYTFFQITAGNIIFNDGLRWLDPEAISDPSCFGGYDLLGVSTHEIGHTLGLGHSCDDGESCPDPLLRDATMYWSVSSCNSDQQVPNADDWGGINAAYGVGVDFEIAADDGERLVGPAPFSATMTVPTSFQSNVLEYDWNFGDGTPHEVSADATPVSHTWETEGQYTITLTIQGEDEECGGAYEARQRKVGVVLACDPPRPAFTFSNDGDFTVQVQNTSDLGAFGCITDFVWVLDGDEATALQAYEPTYRFDDGGAHEVTLRASGPGGTEEFSLSIEAKKASDAGCNASVAGGRAAPTSLLLGLLGACVVRSRRRP